MKRTFSYSVKGSTLAATALGTLIFFSGLIPSVIVGSQWLGRSQKPGTDPLSVLPGIAIILVGLKLMTDRVTVTIDVEKQSLIWKHSNYGVTFRTVIWPRSEIEAIETTEFKKYRGNVITYYTFSVRGSQGRRDLLRDFTKSHSHEVYDTARFLDIPMEPVQSLQ